MDNRSKVVAGIFAGGVHATAPIDESSDVADDNRVTDTAREELALIGIPRVNVLLAGRDTVVSNLLSTLLGNAQKPVSTWLPGEALVLPQIERGGAIVLHDVGSLPLQDQIQLLEWLGRAMGRLQVISTTPVPLLARVRAGAFIDTLYYRLNTVYMDLTDLEDAA